VGLISLIGTLIIIYKINDVTSTLIIIYKLIASGKLIVIYKLI